MVGISEIIIRPGLINVDFADVRTIMGDAGTALMGIGRYICQHCCFLCYVGSNKYVSITLLMPVTADAWNQHFALLLCLQSFLIAIVSMFCVSVTGALARGAPRRRPLLPSPPRCWTSPSSVPEEWSSTSWEATTSLCKRYHYCNVCVHKRHQCYVANGGSFYWLMSSNQCTLFIRGHVLLTSYMCSAAKGNVTLTFVACIPTLHVYRSMRPRR